MANQPNFTKVTTTKVSDIAVLSHEVECNIDSSVAVTKIISCAANAGIVDATGGSGVAYTGFVNFQVIYEGEDGQIYSTDTTVDFKDTYATDQNFTPIVTAKVVDLQASLSKSASVVASIEVTIRALDTVETDALVDYDGANEQRESITTCAFVGMLKDNVPQNIDIEIKDDVTKILSVTPTIFIDQVVAKAGYAHISGGVYTNICYMGADNLYTYSSTSDLDFEVAGDIITDSSKVLAYAFPDMAGMSVNTTVEDGRAHVSVALPINFVGYVFDTSCVEVVTDLYSYTNELLVSSTSLESTCLCEEISSSERIDGSITIGEDMPEVDDVIGVTASHSVVTNTRAEGNDWLVEGIATVTVAYKTNATQMTNSVSVDVPFSIPVRVSDELGQNAIVNVSLVDLSAKGKRGREIEVFGKLNIHLNNLKENIGVVISEVQVGEPWPEPKYIMSVYFVKDGETMWDLAKRLNMPEDELLRLNPDITLPIKAGDKFFVYRKR